MAWNEKGRGQVPAPAPGMSGKWLPALGRGEAAGLGLDLGAGAGAQAPAGVPWAPGAAPWRFPHGFDPNFRPPLTPPEPPGVGAAVGPGRWVPAGRSLLRTSSGQGEGWLIPNGVMKVPARLWWS